VERAAPGPFGADDGGERGQFQWIAQRRAGAVRFDEIQLPRRPAGVAQRRAEQVLLRGRVRRGETGAAAVVIDGAAVDHRPDVVAVGDRVSVALEHDDAAAFATDHAVGRRVERPADPAGRERRHLTHEDAQLGREHQVHAAGECGVALTGPQRLCGEVYRDERRGACGVQHHAGAVEAERIGDPARAEAGLLAAGVVRIDAFGTGCLRV
jgi:hypothetical protein